jgi:hypothetical protein
MANQSFLPSREAELVTWSNNFNALLSANGPTYGILPAQSAAYTVLHDAWISAYQTASDNSTRTPSAITAKNLAKEALIEDVNGIRKLVGIIQEFPGTTNVMRRDLEITVRDTEPTPAPVPSAAPGLSVVSAVGRTVTIRMRDTENPDSRGRPPGVDGATVLSYLGSTPPAPEDIAAWTFEGNSGRTTMSITFPPTVQSGATVWLTAFWFNTRKESGPSAQPLSTQIPASLPQAA